MPRCNLNYQEKLKLINYVNQYGVSSAQNTFHVSRATVFRVMRKEEEIKEKIEEGKGKMKRIVNTPDMIDKQILDYITMMNNKGYPLTISMICQKAVKVMNDPNFKGTVGWFQKFKKRNNVKYGKLSGESAGINCESIDNFKAKVIPNINKYSPNRRYNVDETSLFYRQLPSKTFFIKKGPHYGTKVNKERITILFGCNQIGEKLPPLVISKSKNPRSFRGNLNKIRERGVIFESNKAAWMVKSIFFNYINNWHNELKNKGEKVALILDNFSGHKIDENSFPYIEFFWLPPNTTCFLQPLDGGIIRSFKSKFVKKLLEKIIQCFENESSLSQISKSITLFDAVEWLADSWDEITNETITNCWRRSGYGDDEHEEVESMIIDGNNDFGNIDNDDNDEVTDIEKLFDTLPINSKSKPTLVQYMKNMNISETDTYYVQNEGTSRGV